VATSQAVSAHLSAKTRTDHCVTALESLLLALIAGLAVWKGLLPGWRMLNTDFPNYYVAARLMRSHYCLDRLYDWIWFQRMAGAFGISNQLVGFLGLTPFSALPVIPVSWLPVLEAKRAWLLCNVALLAAAVSMLSRHCGLNYRRTWLIALCAIIPLRTSFLFGQMHILVLALLVAAYVCHMRAHQIGSGCCIALAAALKVYPLFFCIYFLVKKRWTALAAAVVCLGLCVGVSYLIAGRPAMSGYLFQQLPRSLQGESGNPFLPSLTSSSALFHRLFLREPELNPQPLISSPALYTLLYPLLQAILAAVVLYRVRLGFRADNAEALEWSAFLCLLMFLSSAPASYQFVVLIALAVPTATILLRQQRWRAAVVFLCLYFAACNLKTIPFKHQPDILTPFLYLKLWSGVALIAFYYWTLKPPLADSRATIKKLLPSSAIGAALVVLGLWIPGAYGAWSHLRTLRPAKPISISPDPAYMRISPVSTDTGFIYVAMESDGYRIQSTRLALPNTTSNQFSFAAAGSGQDIWVESNSGGISRLTQIVPAKDETTNCRIDHAETPALSDDGSFLAFVREDQGHGSLWVLDVRHCGESENGVPRRVTAPAFDVRTVSATVNHTFLIGAVYQGQERVFIVTSGKSPQLLAEARGQLDSPVLSPDGKALAVRELIAERWQLMLLNLSSRRWEQLTHEDCNAYTPSWKNDRTLLYATDCMRGLGLSALTSVELDR
jgi:uncharacterized membrane protein